MLTPPLLVSANPVHQYIVTEDLLYARAEPGSLGTPNPHSSQSLVSGSPSAVSEPCFSHCN